MVIAFVINDNLTHLIHRQCASSTPHEHVVDEYCKIKLSINCNDFVQLQLPQWSTFGGAKKIFIISAKCKLTEESEKLYFCSPFFEAFGSTTEEKCNPEFMINGYKIYMLKVTC